MTAHITSHGSHPWAHPGFFLKIGIVTVDHAPAKRLPDAKRLNINKLC